MLNQNTRLALPRDDCMEIFTTKSEPSLGKAKAKHSDWHSPGGDFIEIFTMKSEPSLGKAKAKHPIGTPPG